MNPTHILGNERDQAGMSTGPGTAAPDDEPVEHGLPDDEAEKLGKFA